MVDSFTEEYYTPISAQGFDLKQDSAGGLLLRTFRPDTMFTVIPEGGFRRIVAMSSTQVGYLEAAGAADRLVAASSPQYITSEVVRAMNLPDVGHDGAMNWEQLLAVSPDMVLIYGIGGPSPIEPKLKELGVPYVYISDFQENNPIGRAEWLVAVAALAGSDARKLMGRINRNYEPTGGNLSVMLNAPYGGTWFVPGRRNYMSILVADAGGQIVARQEDSSESSPIDLEEALVDIAKSDLWLCPGEARSLAQLRQAVPKARFQGRAWNQTPDFYERGAARPDEVLAELQTIINGSAPDSLHYFYRLR